MKERGARKFTPRNARRCVGAKYEKESVESVTVLACVGESGGVGGAVVVCFG